MALLLRAIETVFPNSTVSAESPSGKILILPSLIVYLLRCFGSRYSRRPSPMKLNARTVNAIALPGKNRTCGELLKNCLASSIIVPQLGDGGGIPSPRNDSEASESTAPGMPSDACTINSCTALG